jgi:hypothetical protein
MCSAEKFGAASSEEMTSAIVPPISRHPTRHFSTNNRLIRSGFCKWSRPLLIDSSSQTEFDVTHSKQSIRKFLTGARTHISVLRFCAEFIPKPSPPSRIVRPISYDPLRHFSQNNRLFRSSFYKWSRPLPTETSSQTEFDATHSKQTSSEFLTETRIEPLPTSHSAFFAEQFPPQNRISNRFCTKNRSCTKETIKPSLTGSRFACKVLQFRDEFRDAPDAQRKKESASRDASEQGKIPVNAQQEKEPQ